MDSVLAQTYSDHEVIVVDDGSSDDTVERLAQYGDRITYIHQENQERSAARNHGTRLAQGEYIAFLDADDYWLPEKLTKQVAMLDRHPDIGMVYCWMQAFQGDRRLPSVLGTTFEGQVIEDAFEGLLFGKSIPLSVLIRSECIHRAGLFDRDITVIEDWALWLRVALRDRIGLVPQVLACYRRSGKFRPIEWDRHGVQETRVLAVERAFAMARADPDVCLAEGLERRAMSRAHWRGALIDYAVGRYGTARERWVRAHECDPAFFGSADEWIESLIEFAAHLYDADTPQAEAEQFIATVYDHLPETLGELARTRREAMGRLKAGYAFQALKRGEPREAAQLMRRALVYHPPLGRNLGVLTTCLRDTWLYQAKTRILSAPRAGRC